MFKGNLQLKLGNFVLDSGDFEFESNGVTVLFGRSGSGKSTLLRAMSGLDRATHGSFSFMGESWQNGKKALAVEQRDLGFVFQTAALLPAKTVKSNLDYAIKRVPKSRQHGPSYEEINARVGITHLLDRSVDNLSGGERQRVAIARALLARPRVLMMDEPLSALDWRAKSELLALIESMIADYKIPTLYITHAPIEVERLASRVVFMADGRITSVETLQEATSRIDSPLFTEEGPVSVLQGTLGGLNDDGLMPFESPQAQAQSQAFRFWLSPSDHRHASTAQAPARLRVLARDVSLSLDAMQHVSILNQIAVTIETVHPPKDGRVTVACRLADGQGLLSEITLYSRNKLALAAGQKAYALVKSVALLE